MEEWQTCIWGKNCERRVKSVLSPEKYRVLAYFLDRILYRPGYISYHLFSNCHVESTMEQRRFVKLPGSLKRESQPVLVLGVRKSPEKILRER